MAADLQFRRMLLALDPDDWPAEALESITRLAAGLTAEIEGLYIEDAAITRAAALPATRIVSPYLGAAVQLDRVAMRRALRARAATARARLQAAARRSTVHWRFATADGEVFEQLVAHTRGCDLIVLTHARRRQAGLTRHGRTVIQVVEQAACSVLLLNRQGHADRSVLAVFEGDESVLPPAADMARVFDAPLTVLAVTESDPAPVVAAAQAWLEANRRRAEIRVAIGDAQARAAIRALQPGLTIARRDGLPARDDTLSDLANETSLLLLK